MKKETTVLRIISKSSHREKFVELDRIHYLTNVDLDEFIDKTIQPEIDLFELVTEMKEMVTDLDFYLNLAMTWSSHLNILIGKKKGKVHKCIRQAYDAIGKRDENQAREALKQKDIWLEAIKDDEDEVKELEPSIAQIIEVLKPLEEKLELAFRKQKEVFRAKRNSKHFAEKPLAIPLDLYNDMIEPKPSNSETGSRTESELARIKEVILGVSK